MALLTDEQLQEIREVIRDHHSAFVANTISPDAVAADVLERLKEKGLISVEVKSIEDSYLYGQLLASLEDPKLSTMSFDALKTHLQKNPIPLTDIEKRAVAMAQNQAAQFVTGLGNRVDQVTGQMLIEADADLRRQQRDEIKTAVAENIARRESVRQLKSDLGHASGDWTRDWDRVAITEKHGAMQKGTADHYGKRYGGDVRVFIREMADACEHCKRVHNSPDGMPRIFKLSDLEKNGTNVGRKARDWLPVIPPVHPHCQGIVVRMPAGWGFNEQGEMVPGGELGAEYKSASDLKLALQEEMDLHKAFKLQGHLEFQGMPIAIENKVGSVRKWKGLDGTSGQTTMLHAYGYFENTLGADGDEIDVYVGPDPRAATAFIVHQQDPATGLYDEEKVMVGFGTLPQALDAYRTQYNRNDFDVGVTSMGIDQLKRWMAVSKPQPNQEKTDSKLDHVIPLQKASPGPDLATISGKSNPTVGSGASISGAARTTVSGTGINFIVPIPARVQPPPTLKDIKGDIEENLLNIQYKQNAAYLDIEVFDFGAPMRFNRPLTIPVEYVIEPEPQKVDEDEQTLKNERLLNKPVKNQVPIVEEG